MALFSTIDRPVEDNPAVRESHGCLDAIGSICKAPWNFRLARRSNCGEEKEHDNVRQA
jgi:hypothetical protein